ncbi:hypothetical protein R1sor_003379 [Riccia sorocarpa]|uniref:Prefoldin subunit 6 n=1 Tax=Riccia sorocarpa TaxID=122646 RepID=A0ABD3H4F0_9MARC
MAAAKKELQLQLETQVNALQKFQKDIAKNHQVRRQYTIQHGENEMVQKELELLNDDANVFKLIGPVLVKQDLVEAKTNVNKRISYITAELKRLDATLKTLEESQAAKRDEVLRLQQRIQGGQPGKGRA